MTVSRRNRRVGKGADESAPAAGLLHCNMNALEYGAVGTLGLAYPSVAAPQPLLYRAGEVIE